MKMVEEVRKFEMRLRDEIKTTPNIFALKTVRLRFMPASGLCQNDAHVKYLLHPCTINIVIYIWYNAL